MGAGTGLLGGGALLAQSPEERAFNMAAGTAGGAVGAAVMPPLMSAGKRVLGAGINAARRAWNSLRPGMQQRVTLELQTAAARNGVNWGAVPQAVRESAEETAARALRAGDLDADAIVRQARGERFGMTGNTALTRGQLTRDPMQYATEQDVAKIQPGGEGLLSRFQNQDRQLVAALDDTVTQIGGEGAEQVG